MRRGTIQSPVLVGRQDELGVLRDRLAEAQEGRGSTVVVGGEAGVGKTRLISEVAREARADGFGVAIGECIELGDDGYPLAPFVDVLRAVIPAVGQAAAPTGSARRELARLLPDLEPEADVAFPAPGAPGAPAGVTPSTGSTTQTRLFEVVARVIDAAAAREPWVVCLEDLHWADTSTQHLFLYLARRLRSSRVLLLGTYRNDVFDPSDPLRQGLLELDRKPDTYRIELEPLAGEEVRAMVEAIDGAPPADGLVAEVLELSDGNPFYVEELLAATGGPRPSPGIPLTLREIFAVRLSRVGSVGHTLLGALAVAARDVDEELLGAVSGLDDRTVATGLADLLAQSLIVRPPGGDSFGFRHALARAVVYEGLLPSQRLEWHRRLAESIASHQGIGGLPGAPEAEIAYHWDAAREPERALPALLAAGSAAASIYAWPESWRHYRRALAIAEGVHEATPALRRQAARAAELAGDREPAIALLRELVDAAPSTDPQIASADLRTLALLLWEKGEHAEALVQARHALATAPPGASSARANALETVAVFFLLNGDHESSRRYAAEAEAMARSVDDREVAARAASTLGAALVSLGEFDRGIERIRSALAQSEVLGDPDGICSYSLRLSVALDMAGETEASLAIALEGARRADALGLGWTQGRYMRVSAAETRIELGQWHEASDELDELLDQGLDGLTGIYAIELRAFLDIHAGRFAKAESALLATSLEALTDPQYVASLHATRAELHLLRGEPREAVAVVRAAWHQLEDLGAGVDPAVMRLSCISYRALADVHARARSRRGGARTGTPDPEDSPMAVEAVVEKARAAGQRIQPSSLACLALIDAERGRLASDPDPTTWRRAVAQIDATGGPADGIYARIRLAETLLARGGQRREATECLSLAAAAADRLGASVLASEVDKLATRARLDLRRADPVAPAAPPPSTPDPWGLSEREREVLGLVAGGLTNRQIADRLYITPKTAGVHVSHILRKLDVTSRAEAAAAAVRADPSSGQPNEGSR